MIVYYKKDAPFLTPKHLALVGNIYQPPISWRQTYWQTLATENSTTLSFAQGYGQDEFIDEALLNEAQRKAQIADLAVICVHTTTTQLPIHQHQLIRSVALIQPNIWVCVWAEGLLSMPWEKEAKVVVQVPSAFSELSFWEELNKNSLG